MTRKRLNFLNGFAVGVAIIAFVNGMAIVQGEKSISDLGAWIDLAVQAAIIGAIIGVVAAWFGERGKKAK
jgi:membrane associated rhomboid family serine protease